MGQRLAPNPLGRVGETPPRVPTPKEADSSIQAELNHVQSTNL